MTKNLITLFLLFTTVISASAQEGYITLRGNITDSETHESLPAVTVYVAGQAIYTQSNADGDYVLKVPVEQAKGSIVYALMGYLRDTVAVATFWQQYNFIPLEKSIRQKLTQRLNAQ